MAGARRVPPILDTLAFGRSTAGIGLRLRKRAPLAGGVADWYDGAGRLPLARVLASMPSV